MPRQVWLTFSLISSFIIHGYIKGMYIYEIYVKFGANLFNLNAAVEPWWRYELNMSDILPFKIKLINTFVFVYVV